MAVYFGWKNRNKKQHKKKQVKKFGGGVHEIRVKKAETFYANLVALAKYEFGLDDNVCATLEVNGVDITDFLDYTGQKCTYAQYLKQNGLYSSRCKVYRVTDELLHDSGICTSTLDAKKCRSFQGTSSSVQDIPPIENPISITYRKNANECSVSLPGKVSVIEKESCSNPDIMNIPYNEINPIQYGYSICQISKVQNVYIDWIPTECGEQMKYIYPKAKQNEGIIIHGPDEVQGYDICDFVIGIVVKYWEENHFVEWICDGQPFQSGKGLYIVNVAKSGLYYAKVTYNNKQYNSSCVCVFESFGFLQVGHTIIDIPSRLDTEKTEEQEANVGCSSINSSGHVPCITSAEFQLGDEIGRGNFGTVFKGSWLGTDVAIKKLPIGKKGKIAQTNVIKKEIEMLSRLRHPNLVQIMAYCLQAHKTMILFEFMEGCVDLDEIIFPAGEPKIKVNDEEKVSIALKTAQGLAYLHGFKPPVIHQDLKTSNILVSKTLMVKICNLGVSCFRTMQTKSCGSTIKCVEGTPLYMSPECLLKKSKSTPSLDMWSFACTGWNSLQKWTFGL